MRIRRIEGRLPGSFHSLLDAASNEGVRNMNLLTEGWLSGEQRFDTGGAALFGAFDGSCLVGIGGITAEPGLAEPAMRMRRFYVRPDWRRRGVARCLADAAMAHGLARVSVLTCNARATALAGPFWEAMGFAPVEAEGMTHIYRAAGRSR